MPNSIPLTSVSRSRVRAVRDAEALARWRAGDEVAGRELFARAIGPLYRYFCNKIDNGVEDLIQDTLLTCLQSTDHFRGESDFTTFALGVARNKLYKHWRAAAGPRGRVDFTSVSVADLAPTPSQIGDDRHDRDRLLAALRRLPIELQEVLELHYWEELSAAQIGAMIDTPEGTVRSRLRRAKQLLGAALSHPGTVSLASAWEHEARQLARVLVPGDKPAGDA